MSRTSFPTISVVMPAYNREDYVGEAIESILNQTFEDFEFIIVDDGSEDSTADIIRRYARMDSRIRAFTVPHGGAGYAANICISKTNAKWLARLDSDDVALPRRLETQLAWVQSNKLDICGSQPELIGKTNGEIWFPVEYEAIKREFFFRLGILQGGVLIRTVLLRDHNYKESTYNDDYELWTRIIGKYRIGNIPQVLFQLRVHDEQNHIVNQHQVHSDFQRYRFRYFYEVYPNTPITDYLALARVSDKQPMTSISELCRAGQWLAELADHPDPKLRAKMAGRWEETCRRSQNLGDDCQAVFEEYREQIGSEYF